MLRRLALVICALTGAPLAIAWIIARQVMHPAPRVEDHTLTDFELPAESIVFPSRDGTRLAGWFIPARDAGAPTAAVVLSHGWARSRAELLPHADFLHRAGFAVLAFDYRHRGESGGDASTLGLRERDDLLGALDVTAARPEVDPARIAVLGMSTGSAIAVVVAARDQRVRAVVAECPFASHDALLRRSLRHYSRLPAFPFGALARWVLELRLGASLDEARPLDAVRFISPRPLFIIADEQDAVVGADETERLFQAAAEPKRFWLVPGADHARGWQAAPEEYERRVVGFLNETLVPEAAAGAERRQAGERLGDVRRGS